MRDQGDHRAAAQRFPGRQERHSVATAAAQVSRRIPGLAPQSGASAAAVAPRCVPLGPGVRAGTEPRRPGARLGAWAATRSPGTARPPQQGALGRRGGQRPGRRARRAREPQVVPSRPFSSPFPFSRRPPSRPWPRHFPRFLLPLQSGGREGAKALSCLQTSAGPAAAARELLRELPRPRCSGAPEEARSRAAPGEGLRAVPAPPRLPASSPRQPPRDSPLCWMRTRAHRPPGPA